MAEVYREVTAPAGTSRRVNLMSAGLAWALWGGSAHYVNYATPLSVPYVALESDTDA